MWMSSWNKLYPANRLYCNNGTLEGYYVGKTTNPENSEINLGDDMKFNFDDYLNVIRQNIKNKALFEINRALFFIIPYIPQSLQRC